MAKQKSTKPAKGKRFTKTYTDKKTGRKRKVSYGQAGAKNKRGKRRIQPSTKSKHNEIVWIFRT